MRRRFSTDEVASHERFAFWREVICAVYVELDAEPLSVDEVDAHVEVAEWRSVRVSHVTAGPQLVQHRESEPRDDLLLSLQVEGMGVVRQDGRQAVIGPGDFALYDATRAYELRFDDSFQQIVVQLPRPLLEPYGVDLEAAVAHPMAHGVGMNDVVVALARSLDGHIEDTPVWAGERVAGQLVDCLATCLALGGIGHLEHDAHRTAQRQAVLNHVHARIDNPALSVATIAAAFNCTTRSLQKLFEDGPGLSTIIRERRLEAARAALVDPRNDDRSIAYIGGQSGFGDPSAFARAFRRRFGVTPTEVRSEHRIRSDSA
ncbi:MAG: helix-turn-helix domain-containing protein [Actinomycetota bacterium]